MSLPTAGALAAATSRLAAAGVESPRHDAESLLAFLLGMPRSRLATLPELDDAVARDYEAVVRRRTTREPLQHITGTAGFRYLDLEVGPGVFVPRPETEVMTGVAVDELRRLVGDGLARPLAVDLCTGSGAVAISMAAEVPGAVVTAVELSPAAHAYAVRNAAGHEVDVRLGDIAAVLADLEGRAHVVTANPPYIPMSEFESVALETREFDPPLALWCAGDGLDVVRTVSDVAAGLLADGGLVACEHADLQGESAPRVFASAGVWADVRDHPDLAGRPRFVTARRMRRLAGRAGTMSP